MKEKIKKTFIILFKNPLWIIVILLIVMIFLLWNISAKLIIINRWMPSTSDIPYYDAELERIINTLDDIYWKLR